MKPPLCDDMFSDDIVDIDDSVDELLSDGPSRLDHDEQMNVSAILSDIGTDKTVHADFDNDFGDLFDDEDCKYLAEYFSKMDE